MYSGSRPLPSRRPYAYLLNGNINFNILGVINAPFSFVYSNQGNQYTQPSFNQTSFHPTYKWVATHFGDISTSYSPFTVNGHLFKGLAVDLTPGKFIFSALYGKFQAAVNPQGTIAKSQIMPTYKRMGFGFKTGFNSTKIGQWTMSFFNAKDILNSLPKNIETIKAQENYSTSLQFKKQLFKKLIFNIDYGVSLLTENINAQKTETNQHVLFNFLPINSSSCIYNAIKSNIALNLGKLGFQMGYEKIDPNYKTLGAYYFNNDFENITAGFNANIFKQKIAISANAGKQRDNINQTKASNLVRTVGNVNLNAQLHKKIQISGNYSNFLSYTNARPFTDYQNQINPYLKWDTLNFRQISQNINGNLNYTIKNDSVKNCTFNGGINYQTAADNQNGKINNGNIFYNGNMAFNTAYVKTGNTIGISLNLGRNTLNTINIVNISPCLNIGKTFFKKLLKSSIALSYTNSYMAQKPSGSMFNTSLNVNYTLQKFHQFNFTALLLNRKDTPNNNLYIQNQRFTETTFQLVYSVNMEFFNLKRKLK